MNIRTFQIIVPVISSIYVAWQFKNIVMHQTKWKGVWPGILFALAISIIAVFPDQTTNWLANTLDFKSNINAFIFVLLGLLFILVILLYDLYKKQKKIITKLAMELALVKAELEDINK